MNLDTATYPELDRARVEKEKECRRLYLETRDNKTPDTWKRLQKCEDELYRIATALDKAMRR